MDRDSLARIRDGRTHQQKCDALFAGVVRFVQGKMLLSDVEPLYKDAAPCLGKDEAWRAFKTTLANIPDPASWAVVLSMALRHASLEIGSRLREYSGMQAVALAVDVDIEDPQIFGDPEAVFAAVRSGRRSIVALVGPHARFIGAYAASADS